MKKILLKNGTIVTSKKCYKSDVLIEGEIIKEISKSIKIKSDVEVEIIDCKNKFIFPGFIDGHTHFDLSVAGTTTCDDFEFGTKAAVSGGTTTIIDYGTQYHNESLNDGLNNWLKKASNGVYCDFGIHMSITEINKNIKNEISDMIKNGITTFKLYTTYDTKLNDYDIYRVMDEIGKNGGLVGVHCENDGIISALREEIDDADICKVSSHSKTRPAECEAEAINRIATIAHLTKAPFLAVHVSCEEAFNEVKLARKKGWEIYAETCPQYLFFTDEVYNGKFDEASKFVIAPPLRKKKDKDALWKGINNGGIDIVSTDHCSFTTTQKKLGQDDFRKIPGGLNLVEYRGILFFDAVVNKKLKIEKMCEILSKNPAKLFGLYNHKGYIKEGYDADIVIINPKGNTKLSLKNQISKSDYCVFENKKIKGKIEKVFLRGNIVVDNGEIVGGKIGKFVKREKYQKI